MPISVCTARPCEWYRQFKALSKLEDKFDSVVLTGWIVCGRADNVLARQVDGLVYSVRTYLQQYLVRQRVESMGPFNCLHARSGGMVAIRSRDL